MLSAIAQWFVWIKLEWAINATSRGKRERGRAYQQDGERKNAEIRQSSKNLIGFMSKALEWRFVEAADGRAEGRGNSSQIIQNY